MIENHSAPLGTMIPALIYNDVAKAIDWLCHVFGFTERLRIAGGDGAAGHAQLSMGEGGVMLGASRTEGAGTAESVVFGPPRAKEVSQSICVRVEDVDRHYEHAKQRGARIVNPPTTYPYGERQYSAEDCEGHRWTFTQAVADVRPEEWGATAGKIEDRVTVLPRPRWCYLEIPAVDVHVSAAFYEKVFGWNIRKRESGRPSFDDATGTISGAWVTGRGIAREPGLLPYIWVNGIDAVLALAAANGGEIVKQPCLDSPGGAWIATMRDPAGNLIGLHQSDPR